MMSEDRLAVSLGEDSERKRKLEEFSSLYGLPEGGAGGPAAPRSLSENQGTYIYTGTVTS